MVRSTRPSAISKIRNTASKTGERKLARAVAAVGEKSEEKIPERAELELILQLVLGQVNCESPAVSVRVDKTSGTLILWMGAGEISDGVRAHLVHYARVLCHASPVKDWNVDLTHCTAACAAGDLLDAILENGGCITLLKMSGYNVKDTVGGDRLMGNVLRLQLHGAVPAMVLQQGFFPDCTELEIVGFRGDTDEERSKALRSATELAPNVEQLTLYSKHMKGLQLDALKDRFVLRSITIESPSAGEVSKAQVETMLSLPSLEYLWFCTHRCNLRGLVVGSEWEHKEDARGCITFTRRSE